MGECGSALFAFPRMVSSFTKALFGGEKEDIGTENTCSLDIKEEQSRTYLGPTPGQQDNRTTGQCLTAQSLGHPLYCFVQTGMTVNGCRHILNRPSHLHG
jgi:hypothetical protein